MPCYPRYLSDEFLNLLIPGGPLNFLVSDHPRSEIPDRYALDLQLRDRDTLQYYHGTTPLLRIRLDGTCLQAEAANTYRNLPGFDGLFVPCPVESAELQEYKLRLPTYLAAAIAAADSRYYRNRTEGYWQNRLSIGFGREWRPGMDWLVLDREACLSFDSRTAQRELLGPHRSRLLAIRQELQAESPGVWGTPARDDFLGDEVDFLALGPDNELICVELKDGGNANGVYWGPLQACAYREDFRLVLDQGKEDIKRLVRQKIMLGLLPSEAANRIPVERVRRVECVLAVAAPKDDSSCWDRLRDVMSRYPETRIPVVQVRSYEDPGLVLRAF